VDQINTSDTATIRTRYRAVRDDIARTAHDMGRKPEDVALVAVSKTYPADAILAVLDEGQRVFGENYVQEAMAKWPALRAQYPDTKLHLIGPLQSNKARDAVALFDVIQSLDRESLAKELAKEMAREQDRTGRIPQLLVQVNIGMEAQKGGIMPAELGAFLDRLRAHYKLNITGLMCIPPADDPPSPHFALLGQMAKRHGLKELSMGMSADYAAAIQLGATQVRVGSAIFGSRN
jgi:PLP dependent protein